MAVSEKDKNTSEWNDTEGDRELAALSLVLSW